MPTKRYQCQVLREIENMVTSQKLYSEEDQVTLEILSKEKATDPQTTLPSSQGIVLTPYYCQMQSATNIQSRAINVNTQLSEWW